MLIKDTDRLIFFLQDPPDDPSFGVPVDEYSDEEEPDSGQGTPSVFDHLQDAGTRTQQIRDAIKSRKQPTQSASAEGNSFFETSPDDVYKVSTNKAGQTVLKSKIKKEAETAGSQAIAKQAGAKVATGIGAKIGLSTIGGPVGAAITAVTTLWDAGKLALQNKKVKSTLLWVGSGLCALLLVGIILVYSLFSGVSHNGPDPLGGTQVQPQTDSFAAAAAAKADGIVVADSFETLETEIKRLERLIKSNPPQGANVGQAETALSKLKEFQTNRFPALLHMEDEERAKLLAEYKTLVQNVYDAIYPGRKAAQGRVLSLLGSRIHTTTGAGCTPERDLKGLGLDEKTFALIYTAAQQTPVTITCLISGHRKYVGRPPSSGYPRCGSAALVDGASLSFHCSGRAVDFAPNASLKQFLTERKDTLGLKLVKDEGNHLHIEVKP